MFYEKMDKARDWRSSEITYAVSMLIPAFVLGCNCCIRKILI